MTALERVAFRAGLLHAADAALVSARMIERREDAGAIRHQAAIAALRGLAEGLQAEARPAGAADASCGIMAAIAADPADSGTMACPDCSGRLAWIKDASNGHIHARCEHAGCFAVMQ